MGITKQGREKTKVKRGDWIGKAPPFTTGLTQRPVG